MGSKIPCEKCEVRGRAVCSALPDIVAPKLQQMSNQRSYSRARVIVDGRKEPDWFAVIVSGVVKLVRTKSDGRQQIVGLQFPGDFVGRPFGTLGPVLVEAATDLDLCCFPRKPFEALMGEQPELERSLLQRTFDELEVARQWMFVLGQLSARAKVAAFLQLVVDRTNSFENDGDTRLRADRRYTLPLSRTEIGEYLGVTIETVSRQMGFLKSEGIIGVAGLRVMFVRDFKRLKAYAEDEA